MKEWLDHHQNLMPSTWFADNQEWHLVRLAESLHQRTGGHPLLIRYTVERIARAGKDLTSSEVEVIAEPPASSAEKYYRSLWANLPLHARDVMFLFAVSRFSWPLSGLHETLRMAGYDQANAAAGVEAVQHMSWNHRTGWQPFHDSVLLFALEQPEFESRRGSLRAAAITWLKEKAPAYLRRLHLWLLQRDAGDPNPSHGRHRPPVGSRSHRRRRFIDRNWDYAASGCFRVHQGPWISPNTWTEGFWQTSWSTRFPFSTMPCDGCSRLNFPWKVEKSWPLERLRACPN